MKKPSFLERLTGSAPATNYDDILDDERSFDEDDNQAFPDDYGPQEDTTSWQDDNYSSNKDPQQEGELPVDMYQTADAIIIRAIVAGVNPSEIDISITRDMVTIRGARDEYQETNDDNYFHRELFWGSFSRTLLLPEEVIIDEAVAEEKHGMLEIRLPKLDKHRSAQLTVRSGAK